MSLKYFDGYFVRNIPEEIFSNIPRAAALNRDFSIALLRSISYQSIYCTS